MAARRIALRDLLHQKRLLAKPFLTSVWAVASHTRTSVSNGIIGSAS